MLKSQMNKHTEIDNVIITAYSSRLICCNDYAHDTSGGLFNWYFRFQHNCNYVVLPNLCESRHGASWFVRLFVLYKNYSVECIVFYITLSVQTPILPLHTLPSLSNFLCPTRVDDMRRERGTNIKKGVYDEVEDER